MKELAQKECIPCKGGIPPLKGGDLEKLHEELGNGWEIIDEHHLEKTFKFKNFREAMNFTVLIGEQAEEINHHPNLLLEWGKVKVTIWTHKINGLAESDFIFAAKAEEKYQA